MSLMEQKQKKMKKSSLEDDSYDSTANKKRKNVDESSDKTSSKKYEDFDSSNGDKSIKKMRKDLTEDEITTRRRTRSLSNAEEDYSATATTEEFHRKHQITITGMSDDGNRPYVCPAPMLSFNSTPYSPQIRRSIDAAGFPNPTPTQAQAWPIALSGRDVITVAKTGSGKTCGFLLPAFHRLMNNTTGRKRGLPAILVLAPTRELACQIEEECVKFGRSSNIRSACAYGGAPKSNQIRKIQNGIEVLIATPGRLNDLLEMGIVKLDQVMFLVLDEADRM
jgi:ATP-dependent RNA helicase DDX5/DBP2